MGQTVTAPPMTIAKARFYIRVHLERVERECGRTAMRDLEAAIQTLIDDAYAKGIKVVETTP